MSPPWIPNNSMKHFMLLLPISKTCYNIMQHRLRVAVTS